MARLSESSVWRTQGFCEYVKDHQRIGRSLPFALLKVSVRKPHGVGYVGETKDRLVPLACERVERRSLHFDSQHPLGARRPNGGRRLAERRICRPTWADIGPEVRLLECSHRRRNNLRIGL